MTRLQWMTACGLLGAAALPGLAADQYWDANGATAGLGGTGVWSTVDSNWNDATGTGAPAAWTNGNSAIFDGTAGTVSISGGVTAENVHFLVDGYIVQNSTLTLSGAATITVSPGVTATINSTIGTLGSPLIITGGGTLVMGGSGHNGGIDDNLEIHDGTLLADKSGTAGIKDGGRIIIGDGVGALGSAVVRVIGTSTNPLRSLITLRPDGLLDYNGKNLSVENLLFSGGGQVELGGATLNLINNDGIDYEVINGGTAALINGGALNIIGSGQAWSVADDPDIDVEVTITADLMGPEGFRKLGGGTLALQGDITGMTGVLRIGAGRLSIVTPTSGDLVFDGVGELHNATSKPITFTGNTDITTNLPTFSGEGGFYFTGATITLGGTGRTWHVNTFVSFDAEIVGSRLNKDGTGELVLTGSTANTMVELQVLNGTATLAKSAPGINAVGGDITVSGGMLKLGQSEQVGDTASISVGSGGAFNLNGYQETVNTLTLNAGGDLIFVLDSRNPLENSKLVVNSVATLNGDLLFDQLDGVFYSGLTTIDLLIAPTINLSPAQLAAAQANLALLHPTHYSLALVSQGGLDILQLTILPEPSSAIMVLAGAVGLCRRGRRR